MRLCAWCENPIPAKARRDAMCCSVRCRQARHRFFRAVGYADSVAPGRTLRLAYADPPYPGKARLYRDHPDYAGEVDHAALLAELSEYGGWALSTSAQALPVVLALCPPDVRVAACHRGERPTRSRWPLHAWEPVIYCGGRQLTGGARRVDSIVCGVGPLDTLPGRVLGPSPPRCAGGSSPCSAPAPGETLDDLFPGSGAVSRAWAAFTSSPDPSPKPRVDASLTAAGDACDPGALVLVPSSPHPSCSPASDPSSKARCYASSGPQLYASLKASRDASSPAASDGSHPSSGPSPDGYLFPLETAP